MKLLTKELSLKPALLKKAIVTTNGQRAIICLKGIELVAYNKVGTMRKYSIMLSIKATC